MAGENDKKFLKNIFHGGSAPAVSVNETRGNGNGKGVKEVTPEKVEKRQEPIETIPELAYMRSLIPHLMSNDPLIILRTDESVHFLIEELSSLAEYLNRPSYEFSLSAGITRNVRRNGCGTDEDAENWMPPSDQKSLIGSYLNAILDPEIVTPGAIVLAPTIAHPFLFSDSGLKGAYFNELTERLPIMLSLNKASVNKRHLIIAIPVKSELPPAIKEQQVEMPTPDMQRRVALIKTLFEEYNIEARQLNQPSIMVTDGNMPLIKDTAKRSFGMTCYQIEKAITTGFLYNRQLRDKNLRYLPGIVVQKRGEGLSEMFTFHPKEEKVIVPVGVDAFLKGVGELLINRRVPLGSGDLPKVIAFAGYPGTGKTTLVRSLAHMAGHDVWQLRPEFLYSDSLVGSLARRWGIVSRELKNLSKSQGGIIAFLDEAADAMAGAADGDSCGDSGFARQGQGQVLEMLNQIRRSDDFGPIMLFFCFNTPRFSPQVLDRFNKKFCFSPFPKNDPELLLSAFNVNLESLKREFEKNGLVLDDSEFDIKLIHRIINGDLFNGPGSGDSRPKLDFVWNGRTIENLITNLATEMSLAANKGDTSRKITWEALVKSAGEITLDMVTGVNLLNYVKMAANMPDIRFGRRLSPDEIGLRYGLSPTAVETMVNGRTISPVGGAF